MNRGRSRSTPRTTWPWSSPACGSTSSTRPPRPTAWCTRCTRASTRPASAATSPPTPAACGRCKYGVTRHQVLGPRGRAGHAARCIRTGGKFVKATTGYDLTQLIIGSRGHPGPGHRGHPASSTPGPRTRRTVLAPFATLDEVTAAVPRIVGLGHRPADPRVHRLAHDVRHRQLHRARARRPRGDQGHRARLPGGDDGEPARGPPRRGHRRAGRAARRARRARRLRAAPGRGGRS